MQKNHTVRRQVVGRNFSTGKHKCVVTAVMKHRDSGFTCAQWHLKTVSLHLGDRASGWSWTCNVASDDCEPLVFPGSTSGVPGWQLSTTMPQGEELWTELGHARQVPHSGTVGLHVRCATVFTRLYFLSEYCTGTPQTNLKAFYACSAMLLHMGAGDLSSGPHIYTSTLATKASP